MPFAGNIIPRNRWDPVGAKMNDLKIWGVANRPGLEDNLYALLKQGQTAHAADGRIDYNHSDKSRGFFRYSILRGFNDNRATSTSSGRTARLTRRPSTRTCRSRTSTASNQR